MMQKLNILLAVVMIILFSFTPVAAEEYGNSRALSNLTAVQVYFDVNVGVGAKLEKKLHYINETYNQLVEAGIKTEVVVGFRRDASYFVTKGEDDYIFEEDIAVKKKIYEWVKIFKKKGVIMEQCLISARVYDVDVEDFLPELQIVRSGYLSMIGYQAKGYSVIHMD